MAIAYTQIKHMITYAFPAYISWWLIATYAGSACLQPYIKRVLIGNEIVWTNYSSILLAGLYLGEYLILSQQSGP